MSAEPILMHCNLNLHSSRCYSHLCHFGIAGQDDKTALANAHAWVEFDTNVTAYASSSFPQPSKSGFNSRMI